MLDPKLTPSENLQAWLIGGLLAIVFFVALSVFGALVLGTF